MCRPLYSVYNYGHMRFKAYKHFISSRYDYFRIFRMSSYKPMLDLQLLLPLSPDFLTFYPTFQGVMRHFPSASPRNLLF